MLTITLLNSFKGFSIENYIQEIITKLIGKYFTKNTFFISFLKLIIIYHYLILTYFCVCTFTKNASEATLNILTNTLTSDGATQSRISLPASLVVGHWSCREKYHSKTIQVTRCTPINARKFMSPMIALTGGIDFHMFHEKTLEQAYNFKVLRF